MWSQSSRARSRRVVETVSQAASIGSFLWMALSLLGPALVAIAVAFAAGHLWVLSFAAGALSMLVVLTLLLMYPLHPMLRRIFYGVRYRHVEVILEIDGDGRKRHRRYTRFCARIVRTGVRYLADRYCSPGPSVPRRRPASQAARRSPGQVARRSAPHSQQRSPSHTPQVVEGDARILGPTYDELEECWNYQMDLGGAMSAGTDREISLVQEFDFTKVDYEPRLQRTILDPTDHLTLALRLPAESWPVKAEGEEILPGGRPRRLAVEFDAGHREVRLDVSKPRFGRIYRIRWSPINQTPHDDSQHPGTAEVEHDAHSRPATNEVR